MIAVEQSALKAHGALQPVERTQLISSIHTAPVVSQSPPSEPHEPGIHCSPLIEHRPTAGGEVVVKTQPPQSPFRFRLQELAPAEQSAGSGVGVEVGVGVTVIGNTPR